MGKLIVATYANPESDKYGQMVLKRLGEMNNIPLSVAPLQRSPATGTGGENLPSTQLKSMI